MSQRFYPSCIVRVVSSVNNLLSIHLSLSLPRLPLQLFCLSFHPKDFEYCAANSFLFRFNCVLKANCAVELMIQECADLQWPVKAPEGAALGWLGHATSIRCISQQLKFDIHCTFQFK